MKFKFFLYMESKNNSFLLFFIFLLLFYRLLICINYNPEIVTGEANNIWNALQVAEGKALYSDPEDMPFEIFQYTPLSQLPLIAVSKVLNPDSDNYTYYVMLFGRVFNLFLNLLTFYFVYLLLFTIFNVSKTLSLTAAVCGFGLLTHLSFAIRPDSMSLLFIVFSVYLFSKAYFQNKFFYFIFCGLSFAISFFSKQDSFLILSALGLYLIIDKSWKNFFVLSLSFSISFLLLLFLFHISFGNYFFLSIFGGLSVGHSIAQAHYVFERFLTFYGVLFYISIVFGYLIMRKVVPKKEGVFFLVLSIFSFVIAVATSFKIGSGVSYFVPFVVFTILLITYVLNYLIEGENKTTVESAIVYAAIILVSVFVFQQIYNYTSPFMKYAESKTKQNDVIENFRDFRQEAATKKYIIFTADKKLKLFLHKNTVFPNTEFYYVSRFSFKKYNALNNNDKLTHVIIDCTIDDSQLSTLKYFNIPLSDFSEKTKKLNYIIYEHER